MNWLSKVFHRSDQRSPKGDSACVSAVIDRKRLLAKHVAIQIEKAKSHSKLVPREFVRRCERLVAQRLDDISEKLVTAEVRGGPENFAYKDTDSRIYMVVSVMPWTTEEAVHRLSDMSGESPFGYVAMMTNLFLNNWPSPNLTHFFHILICVGGNTFQMHTAMGDYGGFPKAKRDFTVFPIELLNSEERRMTGL